jgi:hypothetical protein
MHTANENDIGPGKVCVHGALDVLINETDPPALRQIGSDDSKPCGGMNARTPGTSANACEKVPKDGA